MFLSQAQTEKYKYKITVQMEAHGGKAREVGKIVNIREVIAKEQDQKHSG
jgi:hypothetical protein